MNNNDLKENKKNVVGSPEILEFMGLSEKSSKTTESSTVETTKAVETEVANDSVAETAEEYNQSNSSLITKYFKILLPYVIVFGIGIFLYFFYFSEVNFNFNEVFKPKTEVASVQKQKNLDELYESEKGNYEAWMRKFYFDISDTSTILDPNRDASGNGLTNFQKYILGLNPKVYGTLGDDRADSEVIADGINPLSGEPLSDYQKQLIEQFIEIDVAVNKRTEPPVQEPLVTINPSTLRGEEVPYVAPAPEPVMTPVVTTPKPATTPKPTTSKPVVTTPTPKPVVNEPLTPKYNKLNIPPVTNYLDIDFNVPGKLVIPSLSLSAPINWPSDPAQNDKALETGTMRIPGTADPGSVGTSYISGHSSGYAWSKGDYNRVFANLAKVPDKASFYIYVTDKKGQLIELKYIVNRRGEFSPFDPEQFKNTADSVVALGTCWPVGGTAKRMVIFGTLDQINRK